jgi:hypothetical protein
MKKALKPSFYLSPFRQIHYFYTYFPKPMKNLLPILLLCLASIFVHAQNMVPNGNFEYYSSCPTFFSQVDSCLGWQPFHAGTSDFFHSCASVASGVSVPSNLFGYQAAASGHGYMGFFTSYNTYKEYIERNITPLTIGRRYEVSLSISISDNHTCATDDIGVYFYSNRPIYSSRSVSTGMNTLPLTPQAIFLLVADTQNWTRVVDTIFADSAYTGIIIGGFKDAAAQVVSCVNPASNDGYAYIDSIVVRRIPYISNQYTGLTICPDDTFYVPYTVYPGVFNTGNSFTVQLSNTSGSFASGTTNVGSHISQTNGSIRCVLPPSIPLGNRYRLRIVSSNIIDSSDANNYDIQISTRPIIVTGTNSPVCANGTLTLSANSSSSGVTYNWTGPNTFSSTLQAPAITNAQPIASGDYYITATLNGCSIKDTVPVIVTAIPPRPITTANSPVCIGQSLNLTATSTPGGTYIWNGPAGFSTLTQNPNISNANSSHAGSYTVRAIDNGCASVEDTIHVAVITAPNVGIYPSPSDTICQGARLTLVGTPTNGGSAPQYQWYKNNIAIPAATTTSYVTNTAADKDIFYCTMTTTGVCADPYTDTSNRIPITVLPWLTPSVSIAATPNTPVNGGEMITFNATPVNGGTKPVYQWKRNNADVIGAISNTWGSPSIANADTICVVMTSNYRCPSPATA